MYGKELPPGQSKNGTKKLPIIIRPDQGPHDVSDLPASVRTRWRTILRLGVDLIGVCALIGSIWFFTAQALDHVRDTTDSSSCAVTACGFNGYVANSSYSSPTPEATSSLTVTPLPSPTSTRPTYHNPTPTVVITPSPTPTITPGPNTILDLEPSSLNFSRVPTCTQKKPVPFRLSNHGSIPLLWWQGPPVGIGFQVKDPSSAYLIQPGKSVSVNLYCSPFVTKGTYKVGLLYNGGMQNLLIVVNR